MENELSFVPIDYTVLVPKFRFVEHYLVGKADASEQEARDEGFAFREDESSEPPILTPANIAQEHAGKEINVGQSYSLLDLGDVTDFTDTEFYAVQCLEVGQRIQVNPYSETMDVDKNRQVVGVFIERIR